MYCILNDCVKSRILDVNLQHSVALVVPFSLSLPFSSVDGSLKG